MSKDEDDIWDILNGDDVPDMATEEGRNSWAGIILEQDDDSLASADTTWTKCLTVIKGDDMILRLIFPDGTEQILDCQIRRSIDVDDVDSDTDKEEDSAVAIVDPSEMN